MLLEWDNFRLRTIIIDEVFAASRQAAFILLSQPVLDRQSGLRVPDVSHSFD